MSDAQYATLSSELTVDPLARGYAGMNDAQALADLNSVYRDNWVDLSASQVFEVINAGEFSALTDANKARVDRVLGLGEGIKTAPGAQARAELLSVFGGGSVTATSLAALANQQRSRSQELGVSGWITVSRVSTARAL